MATTKFSKETYLYWYELMQLIRQFELTAEEKYKMDGKIRGFFHAYVGQEAIAAGCMTATRPEDPFITAYRDHGLALAKGVHANACMAELYGKATGAAKGKGGSMHFFGVDVKFFGGHGIVGAQVPLGTGLAFAHKYRDNGRVCLTFLGDGAMNQGQVYESFNMAALWKLPVIYIIENNRYGMGTSISRSSASPNLYGRGVPFGIPGHQVDGMNVIATYAAVAAAVESVRAGKGPYILEMQTYRYRGHSMSDPAKYRSKDEVSRMRQEHDPIDQAKKRIMDNGIADEAALKEIDKEVKDIVTAAAEFAQQSPEPDPSELWTDVYGEANEAPKSAGAPAP